MKPSSLIPPALLAATAVLVLLVLSLTGRMSPLVEPDSQTYLNFDFSSLTAALTQIRTFGYPLFLKTIGSVERVPFFQWLVHSVACGLFYVGLVRVGYRSAVAFACSATLLLSRAVFEWVNHVTADGLAAAMAIASAGALLAVLSRTKTVAGWPGLVAFTFLAYQIRPAYLFLIPLWPIAGFWLDTFLLRRDNGLATRLFRASGYAAATVLPFLAFCTLRLLVVGHWGLVSFGGYNVVGISAQFLDAELVRELPEELQPLAERIVDGRSRLTDYRPADSYEAMEEMFNPTVWTLTVPAARELCADDPVAVNQLLSQLAGTVIRRRPARYLQWLLWNANHARQQLLPLVVFDRGSIVVLSLFAAVLLSSLIRGEASDRVTAQAGASPQQLHIERHVLLWLAVGFVVAKTLLVILVEPAIGRYLVAAGMFVPAAIAIWVVHFVEQRLPVSQPPTNCPTA
ncbi:MAG: hypothetical protein R3C19_02600 [Planctomycetaceae bacterium]